MSGTITDLTPTHNCLKVNLCIEEVNWKRCTKFIFFLLLLSLSTNWRESLRIKIAVSSCSLTLTSFCQKFKTCIKEGHENGYDCQAQSSSLTFTN